MIDETETRPDVTVITNMIDGCCALFVGHSAEVHGAVLCNLTARWLAGHPDFIREQMLDMQNDQIVKQIEPIEKELFGDAGHPQNRLKMVFANTPLGDVLRLLQTMIEAHSEAALTLANIETDFTDPADIADIATARRMMAAGEVMEAIDVLCGIEERP
jgi:hypothetical protein